MKIRLKKPLPQPEYHRVIPAGVIIDAPPVLSGRLLRLGMGEPVQRAEAPQSEAETQKMKPSERKRGKRHA